MRPPERNIFSTRPSGPRTPAEVAREKTARREHERAKQEATSLERLPEHNELIRYLQRKGRGRDCTDELHCNPEQYEPALIDDVYRARIASDETALREIREVIWAGSWRLHKTHDPLKAAGLVDVMKKELTRAYATMERTHPDDAKDIGETIGELEEVAAALRSLRVGAATESSVRVIEDWYAITLRRTHGERGPPRIREQAKKELETLRVIRDELYYACLFPHWATFRNSAMRKRPRTKK